VLALDSPEVADAAADVSAHLLGVLVRHLEPAVAHRFVRGGDGIVDKSAHLARLFLLHVVERIEILDLGGKAYGKLFRIKLLDEIHAAAACHQRRPGGLHRMTDWRDKSETRNHDATFQDQYSLSSSQ